jgi:hypothetical protein
VRGAAAADPPVRLVLAPDGAHAYAVTALGPALRELGRAAGASRGRAAPPAPPGSGDGGAAARERLPVPPPAQPAALRRPPLSLGLGGPA